MGDCLIRKNEIPDPKEKTHNWDIFTSLMFATWIRRFTNDNPDANKVAKQWSEVVSAAFISGAYNHEDYCLAYYDILGMKPNGGRLIDFVNFYPVSLLCISLEKKTELLFIEYVLNKEDGIYYIYNNRLKILPQTFESKEASSYLVAIELLSRYKYAGQKLRFVLDWLNDHKNENEKWDMGKAVNDKVYFPLSNDWRKRETREADCTERILNLIHELTKKA